MAEATTPAAVMAELSSPQGAEPPATASPPLLSSPSSPPSSLQRTLSVASAAANLVLLPYVVVGKAAIRATSFAVTAPIKVTRHVATSLAAAGRPLPSTPASCPPPADLFGEFTVASRGEDDDQADQDENADDDEDDASTEPTVACGVGRADDPVGASSSTASSNLVRLPVRLVSTGVTTVATLPASALSYSGQKLYHAVSASHAVASSALVSSTGAVVRTSLQVAQGLTYGAFSTAHQLTGLMSSSVRTASYVIPPSVSQAVYQGMEHTGHVSTNVVSYAIAVPLYHMATALVPQLQDVLDEKQCVDTARDGVRLLVRTLGPQNAYYVLKYLYETVNSDEAYDLFLLCQDLLRESTDADNYRRASTSVSASTGIDQLVPVLRDVYDLFPSLDEIADAAVLVADIASEVMAQVEVVPDADDGNGIIVELAEGNAFIGTEETEGRKVRGQDFAEEARTVDAGQVNSWAFEGAGASTASSEFMDAGLSFLSSVCDSDEASSFFDALGDFVDVLVHE